MRKFLILIFLFPVLIFAQLEFVPVSVDYAVFQSTDSSAYIEIYVSIFQGNLTYKQNENDVFQSSFKNTVSIYNDSSLVDKLSHSYINTLQDTSKETLRIQQFNQFIDVFKIDLPFAKYKINIQLIDRVSDKKGDFVFDIILKKPEEKFSFSDIELCSSIAKDTAKTIYYKNGLRVIPHPRRTYDLMTPVLYYYVELYGLDDKAAANKNYSILYYVTSSSGDTLKKSNLKTKNSISGSVVDINGFNTMALPGGDYRLHIVARDNSNENVTSISTHFKVYKPSKQQEQKTDKNNYSALKVDQVYTGMSSEDLNAEFAVAKFIADPREKRIFSTIKDEEGMKLFLTQFWHKRDEEADLPYGSTRMIYLDRTALANEKYGGGRVHGKGWKTDRGRVLITYGKPDEIQRHANTTDSQPYDVWIYYGLEGGSQFIFGDINGFGEYQLLHSTYRKELNNPDWELLIRKTSNMDQNNSDRFR
jgi:GWxTD domain-containing protein